MTLKVIFQGNAKAEGMDYEQECAKALVRYGFTIVVTKLRIEDCGVEIDIVARNCHDIIILVECKGGREAGQKAGGFKSSDNVRKAIASASSLYFGQSTYSEHPFIVLTTYMMPITSWNFNQLAVLPTEVMADVLCDRDSVGIKRWANMDYFGAEAHKRTFPKLGDVLLANRYWNLNGR